MVLSVIGATGLLTGKPSSNSRLIARNQFLLRVIFIYCFIFPCFAQSLSSTDAPSDLTGISRSQSLSSQPEFLPVEEAYRLIPRLVEDRLLELDWQITEGYYLYRHRFAFLLTRNGQVIAAKPVYPAGIAKMDDYFGEVEVYYHQALFQLPLPDEQGIYELTLTSQGCADAGLCYPPREQSLRIDTEHGIVTPAIESLADSSPATIQTDQPEFSLLAILLLAASGGLILNLMPCVFPVLSLKVVSFSLARGASLGMLRLHGLSYAAGVICSFVAIAAIMIGIKAGGGLIGWGFHLQIPWVVGLLTYLFLTMGLSLSGVIELGARFMGLGNSLTSRPGLGSSFFTGMLATVVASPCTAPFMGTALGYAMLQSAAINLTVFAALGFGMALPFVFFSCFPRLARFIPRPGRWLETFKQLMAFPLYAAAVWLLWVLGHQTGVNGMAVLLLGCILVALATWLWGRSTLSGVRWLERSLSILVIAAALSILFSPFMQPVTADQSGSDKQTWQPYNDQTLVALRKEDRYIFVNITADWCLTCLANEQIVLRSTEVQQAFSKRQVTYLKGDWTNNDPQLTRLLHRYGRNGVPLYLLFRPGGSPTGEVLPQILTPGLIVAALDSSN